MTMIAGLIIKIFVISLVILALGVWIMSALNAKNTRDYERGNDSFDYDLPDEIKRAAQTEPAEENLQKSADDFEDKASNS